jgi:hypothetical protein
MATGEKEPARVVAYRQLLLPELAEGIASTAYPRETKLDVVKSHSHAADRADGRMAP